jgi:hypothetical protein
MLAGSRTPNSKSFLVLFFKKEQPSYSRERAVITAAPKPNMPWPAYGGTGGLLSGHRRSPETA